MTTVRLFRRPEALGLLAASALAAAALVGWQRHRAAEDLRQGEAALAERDYPAAREHLARYLAGRPGDGRARLLAARAARRLGEYYDAAEHLRLCREAGGDAEAVATEYDLIELQRGRPASVESLRQRARGGDELALAILEVLVQYDIDTYRLYQAIDGLTEYLRYRPDDLQALLARGHVWERLLYFPDALADYRRAVDAHPDDPAARLRLAETLLIAGTPAEAQEHFETLAARFPDRREVRLGLARCHQRLGRPAEARRLLDVLLADAPGDGEALWERGQTELDEDQPAAAEPWLRRATRALPHDRRVAYSLYRCLLALGRRAEAETVNARVTAIDADLNRLGRLRQEVMKRPDDAGLRCEAGLLFLRNGERQEGLRWLRLALRLDPACAAAREALARAESDRP